MSEKDANDNAYPLENGNNSEAAQALPDEEEEAASEPLDSLLDGKNKEKENKSADLYSYLPPYESPLKKEENPFSFKKFLNQDSSSQKSKGARKKTFTLSGNASSSENSDVLNPRPNRTSVNVNSRMNTNDMSSVLPDFVQDHLVIEQCYLSGSSSGIDINNLNFQNLPDLNLEHRNVHFMLSDDRSANQANKNSSDKSSNLPDFTLGASNFQSVTENTCNNKTLPDFALHTRAEDDDYIDLRTSRRNIEVNSTNNTSQSCRQRVQNPFSPSVPLPSPLDLPSHLDFHQDVEENTSSSPNEDQMRMEENDESHQNFPFDLTAPTEETASGCRGRNSNEAVSKSLPDFLSDGPIKRELNDGLQNVRGIIQNGLPPDIPSMRADDDALIGLYRNELRGKNRRIESLERELERLHSKDQRETASLEQALQEVEKNLKQTAKRAINAENLVLKLKQENKLLKSEISSLQSENAMLRSGNCDPQTSSSSSSQEKNHKMAKELRTAAGQAEDYLTILLRGIENLKALADTMENPHKFQNPAMDFPDEDSASGAAL